MMHDDIMNGVISDIKKRMLENKAFIKTVHVNITKNINLQELKLLEESIYALVEENKDYEIYGNNIFFSKDDDNIFYMIYGFSYKGNKTGY